MKRISRTSATRAALGAAAVIFAVALIIFRAPIQVAAMRGVGFFRDAGPLPFFAAMAVLPAVGFPLSVFFVVAGSVFGPTLGVWQVVAGATLAVAVNLTLSYYVAAHAMRPFAARLADRAGYRIPEVQAERAWKITLLVRLIPGLPFFFQNYLLGVAKVSFGAYLLVSLLIQFVFLLSVVLFGDGLMKGDHRAMAAAAVVIVLVSILAHILRKTWKVQKAPR